MNHKRRAAYDLLTAIIFFGAAASWIAAQPPSWFGMPIAGVLVMIGVWFISEAWKGYRGK